jgi:hypothetical protein
VQVYVQGIGAFYGTWNSTAYTMGSQLAF